MAKLDKLLKAGKKVATETVSKAKKKLDKPKSKPKKKDERSYLQRLKDVNRNTQRVSDREKRRRDRTGSSGLKVGTEEALLRGFLGGTGIAGVGTLVGAGVAADRAGKERGRKLKERYRKMKTLARKAESEGKKTFTYEGKEYSVKDKYSAGAFGVGGGQSYYPPAETKSKKPVKKAGGGMAVKSSSRKSKPRGVGVALRGYGRALK